MEINNKKALHDYFIKDTFECGIELKGTEIKSLRKNSADLKDSFVRIKDGEAFVINMYIAKYEEGNIFNHDERRTRKLLLHKSEIKKIKEAISIDGMSVIPLSVYQVRGKAKMKIGIAKGKKLYDKREDIKRKDLERETRRHS